MPSLHFTTFIAAPAERVFDLSRNLAVLKYVFNNRKESFSSGAGATLISKGETVSVSIKHAGRLRSCMLRLTELTRPVSFTEVQVKGDLENFRHERHFKRADNGTIMIDMIEYGMPRDMVGRILGRFYLKQYLEKLMLQRNETIRQYAETEKWRAVLS